MPNPFPAEPASYGPVPKCSGGEALYILSVFFLGPALAVVGWLMAQSWGVLWPAVCVADRIAKRAQLRDSGALTNEEFEAQKAKLLAEM